MDIDLEATGERPNEEEQAQEENADTTTNGAEVLEWDNTTGDLSVPSLPELPIVDPNQPRPGDPEFERYAKKVLSSEKRKMTERKSKLFKSLTKKSVTRAKGEAFSKGFYDLVSIDKVNGAEYVRYKNNVVVVKKNDKFYARKKSAPFREFLGELSRIANASPVTINGQIETMTVDVSGVLPLDEETTRSVT